MENESRRVLVVEDNPAQARTLAFCLKQAGFDVTLRHDGAAAWETIRRENFNAVVTDCEMPGMTGIELCRKMRSVEQHAKTPIVMVTARELELDTQNLKAELNLAAVYPKPYSPRSLVSLVLQIVDTNCPSVY